MTIDVDTQEPTPSRSLSGKELSAHWPVITRDKDYQQRFEGFQSGRDLAMDWFSYELVVGSKGLLYLAADHTQDLNHPQFEVLDRRFKEFKPDFILYEGGESNYRYKNEQEAKTRGEKGFFIFLAQQLDIPMASADITEEEWVEGFKRLGYSNEDIAMYDVVRHVYATAEHIRSNASLSNEQKTKALKEWEGRIKEDYFGYLHEEGYRDSIPLLPRTDGQPWTQELIEAEIKRVSGSNLNINLNRKDSDFLWRMFRDENIFRDQYIVRKIVEGVQKYDRVMVVMGSAHPLREEAALRQFFE